MRTPFHYVRLPVRGRLGIQEAGIRARGVVLTICVVALVAGFSYRGAAAGAVDLKPQVVDYWRSWQKGPDAAAHLYAKDANFVFYDLEPLKYTGWEQYKAGVVPNILSKFQSVTFTVNDDVKTTAQGTVAWTTATFQADGVLKAAGPIKVSIRHTAIWQRRGNRWLIVHEHVWLPSALPAAQ